MRRVLLIITLLTILPIMSGCACDSKISADEAIAIVKQSGHECVAPGLENMTILENSPHPSEWGEWHADYKGKGHWVVTCVFDQHNEPWNDPDGYIFTVRYDYYENSGIVDFKDNDVQFYP
jgi:hypothetical protein